MIRRCNLFDIWLRMREIQQYSDKVAIIRAVLLLSFPVSRCFRGRIPQKTECRPKTEEGFAEETKMGMRGKYRVLAPNFEQSIDRSIYSFADLNQICCLRHRGLSNFQLDWYGTTAHRLVVKDGVPFLRIHGLVKYTNLLEIQC